jgi:cyanophycinase-like exopeptidase
MVNLVQSLCSQLGIVKYILVNYLKVEERPLV